MAIDNEELIEQLQHVSALIRRDRRVQAKEGSHDHHGKGPHGHGPEGHEPHGESMPHGIGHHKSHGGSGHHGQNRVLAALMLKDGISQKDLAYLLAIRPQSLSQAIDRLEERGLAVRKQNEEDRRITNVFLTDAGRTSAQKVAENRRAWADQLLEPLTEEEKEQLSAILDKLKMPLSEQLEKFGSGHDDEDAEE